MKQVREMSAGKAISAYLVFRPNGELAAKVHVHYGASGVVMVDVWALGLKLQQDRADGHGYDKFTAALSNMLIDKHLLADHEQRSMPYPNGLHNFPADYKPPQGYEMRTSGVDSTYMGCYKIAGLDYLVAFGYKVYQAI